MIILTLWPKKFGITHGFHSHNFWEWWNGVHVPAELVSSPPNFCNSNLHPTYSEIDAQILTFNFYGFAPSLYLNQAAAKTTGAYLIGPTSISGDP